MNNVILLFGLPRSGTTWIGKLFDSHPDTLYRHEPDSAVRIIDLPLFPQIDGDYGKELILEYVDSIPKMNLPKVCAKLPIFPKKYLSTIKYKLLSLSILVSKIGGKVFTEFPIYGVPDGKGYKDLRLVWKSIESLGRYGFILKNLSEAYGIHIIRHPCGYIASILRGEAKGNFTDSKPSSEDYGMLEKLLETEQAKQRELNMERFKMMQPIERLAWRWVLFNEKAIQESSDIDRGLIVRYEDVCNETQNTVKKMYEFVGLSWKDQTAEFVRQSTTNENDSYYSVYKDPKKAALKWMDELDARQIDSVLRVIEDSVPGKLYIDQ